MVKKRKYSCVSKSQDALSGTFGVDASSKVPLPAESKPHVAKPPVSKSEKQRVVKPPLPSKPKPQSKPSTLVRASVQKKQNTTTTPVGLNAKTAPSSGQKSTQQSKQVQEKKHKQKHKQKQKQKRRRWPYMVGGLLLALCVVALGLFSWNRWFRFNDSLDFQGEWHSDGSDAVVVIDGQSIKLAPDVAYHYELNTMAKTLSYTFGNMKGEGRYHFSADRNSLVITDGKGYSWFSTLRDDVIQAGDALIRKVEGKAPRKDDTDDTLTSLTRISRDSTVQPKPQVSAAPANTGDKALSPPVDPDPSEKLAQSSTTPSNISSTGQSSAGATTLASATNLATITRSPSLDQTALLAVAPLGVCVS